MVDVVNDRLEENRQRLSTDQVLMSIFVIDRPKHVPTPRMALENPLRWEGEALDTRQDVPDVSEYSAAYF